MSTQMAGYQHIVGFETRLMNHSANELPSMGSETAQVSSGEHVSVRLSNPGSLHKDCRLSMGHHAPER